MQQLILVRGLPGSGKSTFARRILAMSDFDTADNTTHIEADMFHYVNGEYKYKQSNLRYAHLWCQSITACALHKGRDVIVSNTFTTFDEIYPYIKIAKDFDVEVIIIECDSEYENTHTKCLKQLSI